MSRIESTRRHGPFDPRFRVGLSYAARASTPPFFRKASVPSIRNAEQVAALAAWEGEGGAAH
jgi:hypothetical protein